MLLGLGYLLARRERALSDPIRELEEGK